jgi:hypothetical protein
VRRPVSFLGTRLKAGLTGGLFIASPTLRAAQKQLQLRLQILVALFR